jgi:hypothetical protein
MIATTEEYLEIAYNEMEKAIHAKTDREAFVRCAGAFMACFSGVLIELYRHNELIKKQNDTQ